jgi:starch phosphorylase
MAGLYDRYLGPRWRQEPTDGSLWRQIQHVPEAALWNTHERRRERLVEYVRYRLRMSLEAHGARPSAIEAVDEILDSNILTIGFARRFATYKRVTLLLRDRDRLDALLNNPERPMQVIFAGKAHPRDDEGKELIRQTVELARDPRFRSRLVFVEDYDMTLARFLVQGSDVWLNNPRRPLEASGTSGMKAAANGVLNVSTLDGWWDEAWRLADDHNAPIGWAIGNGTSYQDPIHADRVEADALYELLAHDVIPTFYERGAAQIPHRWVARMKSSIQQLCNEFNTHRMVWDYTERFYLPGNHHYLDLAGDGARVARRLAAWRQRIEQCWGQVAVEDVEVTGVHELSSGDSIPAQARVQLGELTPNDVVVQLYFGRVSPSGTLINPVATPMAPELQEEAGAWLYRANGAVPEGSGKWGYTVRVLPFDADLVPPYLPGLVTWEQQ